MVQDKSYAKINLFLEVLGTRRDDYHQIRTIYQEIDICDEITISLDEVLTVEMDYPRSDLWNDLATLQMQDNIVYKTAQLMQKEYNLADGARILIKKNIPSAAGLGGGSSNAATAIKLLSTLWKQNLSYDRMYRTAVQLGSDVPYFLLGGTALGEGRGEKVTKLTDVDLRKILLIKPNIDISSSKAYSILKEYGDNQGWINFCNVSDRRELPVHCFNRLEKSICDNYPEIKKIIDHCNNNGAVNSILSGSGSTVVSFYNEDEIIDEHYRYFNDLGYWACKTSTKH